MYRQGDVLIKKIDADINLENAEKVKLDNGRIVLAYGEVTGHAHAIKSKNALLVRIDNKYILCVVNEPVELSHEEHKTIMLPIGKYEVKRQREYMPEKIRYVAD